MGKKNLQFNTEIICLSKPVGKSHTRDQEVSLFPIGDQKAARNRHGRMAKTNTNTNNKKDPQKKQCLGTVFSTLITPKNIVFWKGKIKTYLPYLWFLLTKTNSIP